MLAEFDRELLNHIQTHLPLKARPFAAIAAKLRTDEQKVLERLEYLKANGYIRRMGAFFDSTSLGYASTLAAAKVQPAYLDAVAKKVNAYPGITHNYEREGEYNLWFTLLTSTQCEQTDILESIGCLPGVDKLINLPATKKYKVSVEFNIKE